jgi:hypothetical protein
MPGFASIRHLTPWDPDEASTVTVHRDNFFSRKNWRFNEHRDGTFIPEDSSSE